MGMEKRDYWGKVRDMILDSVSKESVGYPRGDRQLSIWGWGQRSLETWGPLCTTSTKVVIQTGWKPARGWSAQPVSTLLLQ